LRAACIDIGSNTTRLLVADLLGGRLVEIRSERAFTLIGQGLAATGTVTAAKIDEVVAVVAAQLRSAMELGADDICAVATAAIRAAANGAELIAAIHAATGLRVRVLSAEQEARLAFSGAARMLGDRPPGLLGVLDVGGGSSEIVLGTAPAEVAWWRSLAIGSSTLTDGWLHADPPTAAELAAARREIYARMEGLRPPLPALAVAVGGSATSLCQLAGPILDPAALLRSVRVLASEPAAVVAQRSGIDPRRARLLPAGLLILEALTELLRTRIVIGRGGVREGVLLEALTA